MGGLFADGTARPASAEEENAAARAVAAGLLDGAGPAFVAGSRLVAIPRAAGREAAARMAPAIGRYGAFAAAAAADLRQAYQATASARRFSWAEVEHVLVAGMLLDLSVGSRLFLGGQVERGYDETLVWAFEETPGANPFGVQWVAAEGEAAGLAQLWHSAVERPELKVSVSAVRTLVRLGEAGPSPEPKDLLLLRYLGFATVCEAGDRPAVAGFSDQEMGELLLPKLWSAARQLVGEAVLPALEAGGAGGWWRDQPAASATGHALVRAALELGTDAALAAGAMAAFPRGRPSASWGRWFWREAPGPFTLVAGSFGQERLAMAEIGA